METTSMTTNKSGEYELETMKEIWHNKRGDHLEIGPDRAGLALLELRYFAADDQKPQSSMCMEWEEVPLLIKALQDLLAEKNSGGA